MNKGEADPNDDEVPIVAEAYGFKLDLKSKPTDLGEEVPLSWREVPRRINEHLIRLAVAPSRLIVEVLEGATRLVRGLSRIPDSVAKRMQRAHSEAETLERQQQAKVYEDMKPQLASTTPSDYLATEVQNEEGLESALNQIQALLQKYKAKGLDAYIMFGPDGKPIIVLGTPPDSEAQVAEAIKQIKSLQSTPVEHDH